MNEQSSKDHFNETAQQKNEKQTWETPELVQIDVDFTESGPFICTDEGACICVTS